MGYWAKTPKLLPLLLPSLIWYKKTESKEVWLSFDDGPTPELTPWVLDLLKAENVKATFFCLGNQIEKHLAIFKRIEKEGHIVGNHSFSHPNGFFTCTKNYLNDIEKCSKIMPTTKLFRPPFGKIYPWQIAKLKKDYQIIMWDILSKDYDEHTSNEACLANVVNNVKNGSIIVMHDTEKAKANLQFALPKIITALKNQGFVFSTTW